ncbi:hypothetical protein PRZ48_009390 [Zasmidium cellare]|uniref:N-acetyltransferase domain-containing protein n=1 Tax=Zasmidium cellare TaxID=395010 RepID=A0ABR0EC85_ZASCE|nr:hypothetical protein PRZ48_009390 [Zasmidium cellare]
MFTARTSPRLTYRPVESTDEDFIWSLTLNHRDWRNFNVAHDAPPSKAFVADWLKNMEEKSMLAAVASLPKDTNNPESAETPIGIVNMVGPAPVTAAHGASMFGLIILPEYQSKGLGTEIFNWAVWWQFECANMRRLELGVAKENEKAVHVYKKAGFQVEGCRREAKYYEGKYEDVYMMALLAHEWREKRKGVVNGEIEVDGVGAFCSDEKERRVTEEEMQGQKDEK